MISDREITSVLQWVRAPHPAVRVALQLSCHEGSMVGLFGPGWQVFHLLGMCISCSSELPLVMRTARAVRWLYQV